MNLREFILGTPEEVAAGAKIKELEAKRANSPLRARNQNSLSRLRSVRRGLWTRRALLGLGVTATGVAAGASAGLIEVDLPMVDQFRSPLLEDPSDPLSAEFTHKSDFDIELGQKVVVDRLAQTPNFNLNYLHELLSNLQRNNGTSLVRSKAALDNICAFRLRPSGSASGLMIDEGGYFLTAAHVVADIPSMLQSPQSLAGGIYHPKSAILAQIDHIIWDPMLDLAIVYAPTGNPSKPVEGLQISLDKPVSKAPLWQLATQSRRTLENNIEARVLIMHGNVDTPSYDLNERSKVIKRLLRIRGMKPFGGSSGGPIIDARGRVVGIESGFYVDDNNNNVDRDKYTGSTIALTKGLLGITEKKSHSYSARRG